MRTLGEWSNSSLACDLMSWALLSEQGEKRTFFFCTKNSANLFCQPFGCTIGPISLVVILWPLFCGRMGWYSPKTSVCHISITVLWVIWAAYRVQITLDALPLWRLGKLWYLYAMPSSAHMPSICSDYTFIYEQSTICGQSNCKFRLCDCLKLCQTNGQIGGKQFSAK